jgi:hypothetical protein
MVQIQAVAVLANSSRTLMVLLNNIYNITKPNTPDWPTDLSAGSPRQCFSIIDEAREMTRPK